MVEVFKTNVHHSDHARVLAEELHTRSRAYRVSFDLSDPDRILRVQCADETIDADLIIQFLDTFGFEAEVLDY